MTKKSTGNWERVEALLTEWRADLNRTYGRDTEGEPCTVLNEHVCPECGTTWDDVWTCDCDDECPECGTCSSPTQSVDQEPEYTAFRDWFTSLERR